MDSDRVVLIEASSGPMSTFANSSVRCWWHWAATTPAGIAALRQIGCTVDPRKPWCSGTDGWRLQPWEDPGHESGVCWQKELTEVREALGEPDAGVMYTEICILNCENCESVNFQRSHQAFIGVNATGTRAAIRSLKAVR